MKRLLVIFLAVFYLVGGVLSVVLYQNMVKAKDDVFMYVFDDSSILAEGNFLEYTEHLINLSFFNGFLLATVIILTIVLVVKYSEIATYLENKLRDRRVVSWIMIVAAILAMVSSVLTIGFGNGLEAVLKLNITIAFFVFLPGLFLLLRSNRKKTSL